MLKSARSKSVLSRIAFETIENRVLLSAGDWDLSFGGDGVVELDAALQDTEFQTARVMVAQADGKILIAGENQLGTINGVCIARTDENGNLDASFGAYGGVTLDVSPNDVESVTSLAVDSATGNIFIGGDCDLGAFVLCLNTSGQINASFDDDGILWPAMDAVTALACDEGSLYIAGTTWGDTSSDIALAKLDAATGNADPLFNNGELAVYTLDYTTDQASSILITHNDDIVLGGASVDDSLWGSNWLIARVSDAGGLIGFTVDANSEFSESDAINSLIEIGDNTNGYTIVAGGSWMNAGVSNCAVASISEIDGSVGAKTLFNASYNSYVNKLTQDADGNIIVAGTAFDDPANQSSLDYTSADVMVTRLDSDLTLDTSFGVHTYGQDYTTGDSGNETRVLIQEESLGVVVQKSGRIVVGTNAYQWTMALFGIEGEAAVVSPVSVVNGELIANAGGESNTLILSSSAGQINLRLDGSTYSFSGVTRVTLNCGAGNDFVLISPLLGVSVDVFGGEGNDILIAGSGGDMLLGGPGADLLMGNNGADILVGGDGNDLISGGNGNDVIIGGEGADLLLGNADQDILIAGNTAHDANPAALKAIAAEWSSSRTYAQRVNNITNGSGTAVRGNGGYFFAADVTVYDDAARDSLAGNSGTDWFIFNADSGVRDLLIDRSYAESAFDVDVNI